MQQKHAPMPSLYYKPSSHSTFTVGTRQLADAHVTTEPDVNSHDVLNRTSGTKCGPFSSNNAMYLNCLINSSIIRKLSRQNVLNSFIMKIQDDDRSRHIEFRKVLVPLGHTTATSAKRLSAYSLHSRER